MKIAFVYDAVYPFVKGGAERRIYEISNRLCAKNEIHLFGMKSWEGPETIRRDNGVFLHGVCPAMALYADQRRSIKQAIYFAVKLLFPLFKEDFDVIECTSTPYLPLICCKLYAFLKRKPLVVCWLEYWDDLWYEYLGVFGIFGKLIERFSRKLSNHIIAISEHTKRALISTGVCGDNITTIGYAVDLKNIEDCKPSSLACDVIFAGRLIKEKRVDVLIRTVRKIVDEGLAIKCCIVGDGPQKSQLQNLSRELGIEKHIIFTGFKENNEVISFMKSSRIFVFPSTREGFGHVVLEANSCGLPVVTVNARHNAAASLISDGQNGIVCDLDADRIADAAYRLLTDENMYKNMQQSSIDMAQKCSWDSVACATEQFYKTVIR